MKLLLDQNLAPSLKGLLVDLGVEITYVKDIGLDCATDESIWELAKSNDYTIVSKDDDFRERVALLGTPPKVVLLRIGNCALGAVEGVIRRSWSLIEKLHENPSASLLFVTIDTAFLRIQTELDQDSK